MIAHEEMQEEVGPKYRPNGTVLHKITVSPEFAPEVTLYVIQRWGFSTHYVVRDPSKFHFLHRRYGRSEAPNFLSKHSSMELALRAALRRARRYEAAYAVDRSRGRFRKGGET